MPCILRFSQNGDAMRLPGLCTLVSSLIGVDEKAVSNVARVIREEGYIKTGLRGAGASNMNFADAANLVFALNHLGTAREASEAIDRYRSLVPWRGEAIPLDATKFHCSAVAEIFDAENFGDAIDELIFRFDYIVADLNLKSPISVRVEMTPFTSAEIRIFKTAEDQNLETIFLRTYIVDIHRFMGGFDTTNNADRTVTFKLTERTFAEINSALSLDRD